MWGRGLLSACAILAATARLARAEDEELERPSLEIAATLLYAVANVTDDVRPPTQTTPIDDASYGPILTGEIGYRVNNRTSVGVGLSLGWLSGSYGRTTMGVEYDRISFGLFPTDIDIVFHRELVDQIWAGVFLGQHADTVKFDGDDVQSSAFGFGLELGWDVAHVGDHWFSLDARAIATRGGDVGFGAICIGVGYHH